jgi:hypothetical protein
MTVKIESHMIPFLDLFLIASQAAMERTAKRTATSKYSRAKYLGSGVMGDGWVYPLLNSGFGNRCFWAMLLKLISRSIRSRVILLIFFI